MIVKYFLKKFDTYTYITKKISNRKHTQSADFALANYVKKAYTESTNAHKHCIRTIWYGVG